MGESRSLEYLDNCSFLQSYSSFGRTHLGLYHFWYQSTTWDNMMNTRMDSRVDSIEGSMLELCGEVMTLKEEMQKLPTMERGI